MALAFAGLRQRSSGDAQGVGRDARSLDDPARRWRCTRAGVSVTGLGQRAGHWSRCASPEFPPMIRRSSAPVRGSPRKRSRARRLERLGARRDTERLVVRVRERSVTRTSTIRPWSCSACTRRGLLDEATRARSVAWLLAMQSANGGWAAFDKDNNVAPAGADPVRRFRRDDRSAQRGRHRARDRDARRARRRPQPSGGRSRARIPVRRAGAGGLVVRPLGRQPYLRHRRGAAGARGGRRADGLAAGAARGPLAGRAPRTPTVGSARAASRTSIATARAAARAPRRRRRGRCSALVAAGGRSHPRRCARRRTCARPAPGARR